jgi:hypothetical protein
MATHLWEQPELGRCSMRVDRAFQLYAATVIRHHGGDQRWHPGRGLAIQLRAFSGFMEVHYVHRQDDSA